MERSGSSDWERRVRGEGSPWHRVTPDERAGLEKAAPGVMAAHPWIVAAWLYGSVARGERARDVDLAILAREVPADWKAPILLANELSDAAEFHVLDLDVRLLNGGNPVFWGNVLRDGRLIYEADRDARVTFEARALSQWLDFEPVWRKVRARCSGGGPVPESHLELLLKALDLLERYAREVTRDALESDFETWIKVRGALEMAAQCAIDLALVICSRRALGVPSSYRDAFSLLARAGLLDAPTAKALEGWAGLRNVLVHIYTTLDLERVHRALGETQSLRTLAALAARELAGETGPA